MEWYPLKLTYHVRTYAFGDRLIPDRLGKKGAPEGIVAETWEISDYRDTTGRVINGALAGRTLHELVRDYPRQLVGQHWVGPHFPLLCKLLDASHMLPVHLHANDEVAKAKYAAVSGKTEAWHILWCAPGATILAGIKPGVSREQLAEALRGQDYDAVMPRYPIQPGDTVYVPGGVLHAFGPDTLIFEVQQTSDLSVSVMPTDLFGNALDMATWEHNIQEALDELRTDYLPKPNPGLVLPGAAENTYVIGAAGPYFALERWTLHGPHHELAHPDHCLTLTNVGARCRLDCAGGSVPLGRAESCIIPAAMGEFSIVPEGATSLVVCFVPNLREDVVVPLRGEGYPDEQIAALGEVAPGDAG